jgi:hypothetical protein
MSTGDRVKELRHLQEATRKIITGVVAGEISPQTGAVVNGTMPCSSSWT